MSLLDQPPDLAEALFSLGILAGSYVAARLLSYLFGRILMRTAEGRVRSLDERLVAGLKRPITYSLFLIGAYAAVHRLPMQDRWTARLDAALFVLSVALLTLAVVRAYDIVLAWYVGESRAAGGEGLATEFGPLFSKVGKVLIGLVATITVLQQLGINVASLVVSLGVGSLAVGLAAQDTLANMFAGFTLMLDRPFKIGDRIQLASGEVGDVEVVGMRATRIRTADETMLVVPNSILVKERLVNQSRPGRHIVTRLDVPVAYGSDVARVKAILAEAARASARVDPQQAPSVLVTRFAEHAVILRLVFWARDYAEQSLAASDVHEEICRRFGEAGIEIPFPTRRIVQEGGRPA